MKTKKGFTLVEMLMVVFVIAILAGMILPRLTQAPVRARDARRISDLHNIQSMLELYFSIYAAYPLASGNNAQGGGTWEDFANVLKNSIKTSRVPDDPKPGSHYFYCVPSDASESSPPQDYILGAVLETPSPADDPNLKNDIDGDITGYTCTNDSGLISLTCEDSSEVPVYCVGP